MLFTSTTQQKHSSHPPRTNEISQSSPNYTTYKKQGISTLELYLLVLFKQTLEMGSKQIPLRRVTSAGYRMPDRPKTKLTSTSSVSLSHVGTKQSPVLSKKDKEQQTWGDAVRQDHVWREFVEAERRGEKNW